MLDLAWCSLRRTPLRSAVAVLAVAFSVVLLMVQTGLMLGLMRNASLLVDESRADLWVSAIGVKTFDFATPFPTSKKYAILAIPGVAQVEELFVAYSAWKLSSGGTVNVQLVGIDARGELGPRLNVIQGQIEDLEQPDAIMIDELDLAKLGHPQIGDVVEIFDHRARIVGVTRGMRSFTTTPYVFTAIRNVRQYSARITDPNVAIYLLVKTAAGTDRENVRRAIGAISGLDANSPGDFAWRTRRYWLIQTGMGVGILGAALLGLLVGGAILSQTLYAMTLEKLPKFGVLKALGATMFEISSVILKQALLCGFAGLLIGLIASFCLSVAATRAGTQVEFSQSQVLLVTAIMAMLSSGAALMSVSRLWKVDPVMVFRS